MSISASPARRAAARDETVDRDAALGTWQGIDLFEHRDRGHTREIALHMIGE